MEPQGGSQVEKVNNRGVVDKTTAAKKRFGIPEGKSIWVWGSIENFKTTANNTSRVNHNG